MTYYYYRSSTWGREPQAVPQETVSLWEKISQKENWRITQLPNGYYQAEYQDLDNEWVDATRRETLEGAESAIDASIQHYEKKLDFLKGPKVVKTFK
tara:strand:+ start:816 stop:1106 length:291 start_codon:yes stop_codon:yes gene_type:complete